MSFRRLFSYQDILYVPSGFPSPLLVKSNYRIAVGYILFMCGLSKTDVIRSAVSQVTTIGLLVTKLNQFKSWRAESHENTLNWIDWHGILLIYL